MSAISPASETEEHFNPMEEFEDTHGHQLSPTLSDIDRSLVNLQSPGLLFPPTMMSQSNHVQPLLLFPLPMTSLNTHMQPQTSSPCTPPGRLTSALQQPPSATSQASRSMTKEERIEAMDNEHVRRVFNLKTKERVQQEPRDNSIRSVLVQACQVRLRVRGTLIPIVTHTHQILDHWCSWFRTELEVMLPSTPRSVTAFFSLSLSPPCSPPHASGLVDCVDRLPPHTTSPCTSCPPIVSHVHPIPQDQVIFSSSFPLASLSFLCLISSSKNFPVNTLSQNIIL